MSRMMFENEDGLKSYLHVFFNLKSQELYAKSTPNIPRRWKEGYLLMENKLMENDI